MQEQKFNIPDFPNKFSNVCFLAEADIKTFKVCKLKDNVQSIKQASFSPILTMGAFILFHHNNAQPPKFQSHSKTNGKIDLIYPSQSLTVNQYHEIWNDYLSHLILEGKVYQVQKTLYLADLVTSDYLQIFSQSKVFECFEIQKPQLQKLTDENDFSSIIQLIYRLERVKIQKTKKFAAVCFASVPPIKDRYLPKVHVEAMFYGIFYRQTDIWTIIKPNQGVFPTQKQLEQLDGVVLSGSAHSVYQDLPEIHKFLDMLVQAYKKNPKLKILGFCFGHQAIAYAFGGKVNSMKQKVVCLENIRFDSTKIQQLQFQWLKNEGQFLSGKQAYYVSEYHGDEVVIVPEGFSVIGSSQSCQVQAMVSNDGRCLSFQFHMEYTPQFGGGHQLRVKSYDPNINYATIYHGSSKIKSCERNVKSVLELRDMSRKFLDFQRKDKTQ